ncbi:MAG: hypothetical protein Q9186_004995 [Xanthomendoza sp. 1 TL-2023]
MDMHQVTDIVTNTYRGSGPTTYNDRTHSTFIEGVNPTQGGYHTHTHHPATQHPVATPQQLGIVHRHTRVTVDRFETFYNLPPNQPPPVRPFLGYPLHPHHLSQAWTSSPSLTPPFPTPPPSAEVTFDPPVSSWKRGKEPVPSLKAGQKPNAPSHEAFNLEPGLSSSRIAEISKIGSSVSIPSSQGSINHRLNNSTPGPIAPLQFDIPRLPQDYPSVNPIPPATYHLAHIEDLVDDFSPPHPRTYKSPPKDPSIPAWCDIPILDDHSIMLSNQPITQNEQTAKQGDHQHQRTINPRFGDERLPSTTTANKNARNTIPPTTPKQHDRNSKLDRVADGRILKKPYLSIPTRKDIDAREKDEIDPCNIGREQTPTENLKMEEPSLDDDIWAFLGREQGDDEGWFD